MGTPSLDYFGCGLWNNFYSSLGFSAGLDFESKIMVKENAAKLLDAELSSPKWEPQLVVMSGVTDPYQPVERKLRITRSCLEVLARFRNPVAIIRVPRERMVGHGIASSLVHEVGHQGAALLGLV